MRVVQRTVLLCLLLGLAAALKLDKATKERKDICTLNSLRGSCRRNQNKWYYDFLSDSCLQFVWSGCGGNRNRFDTQSECIRFCMSPNHKYYMQDFENDYWN